MKINLKRLLFALIVALIVVYFMKSCGGTTVKEIKTVDVGIFIQEVKSGKIKSIFTYPEDSNIRRYLAIYRTSEEEVSYGENPRGIRTVLEVGGVAAKTIEELAIKNEITLVHHGIIPGINWGMILIVALIGLIAFSIFNSMRQSGQIGGRSGGYNSYTKNRARLLSSGNKAGDSRITFKDVAGCEEAKASLMIVLDYLTSDRALFDALGARASRGVLLHGKTGTGKTLLAKALAGEANVPFFSISGSDFVEMFVGVGAGRVRSLFQEAKKNAPCIVFIDEIDAVGGRRSSGINGGNDEREQTLNQLLVEMDGFNTEDGVVVIGATNRMDKLDPALTRPGRFDKKINVPVPDIRGRVEILKIHTRNKPLRDDVSLETIARMTFNFSGADLENLCVEAANITLRRIKEDKGYYDSIKDSLLELVALNKVKEVYRLTIPFYAFEEAWETVVAGGDERRIKISEREKKRIAYHEAGHAIVSYVRYLLEPNESSPLHKVTIIPRGLALGITYRLPEEENLLFTKKRAYNELFVSFGGWAAEKIKFDDVSSGSSNDLEQATTLVKNMVLKWGMGNKLPPIHLSGQENVYGVTQTDSYSGANSEEVNKEIRTFIVAGHQEAEKILKENDDALNALADALLKDETLDREECEKILKDKIIK